MLDIKESHLDFNKQALKIKKHFPIFEKHPEVVYLDSASSSQKAQRVLRAVEDYYYNYNANIHRGIYSFSHKASDRFEEARQKVSKFLNSPTSDSIIFTKNVTASINLLASTIHEYIQAFHPGKTQIVLSEMEHHANLVPWIYLAKTRGYELKYIPIKEDLTLDLSELDEIICEKTAIVSCTHVSNALGTINDIKAICRRANQVGAISIIDAAQSASHFKLDVQSIGCTFLAFTGHKVFAPTGIGVLYGKKEVLEAMPPYQMGGDMIKNVTYHSATWSEVPSKYEAGTPPIAQAIGLGEAIDFIEEIGFETIENIEKNLYNYLCTELAKIDEVTPISAEAKTGTERYEGLSIGALSFDIKGVHSHDVAQILSNNNICIRSGHHCAMPLIKKIGYDGTARASLSIFNTTYDIDKLVESIYQIKEIFKK